MSWNPERILCYRRSAKPDANPQPKDGRVRVGIWDLNTSAGSLPRLLDLIEKCQGHFSFYSVEAAFQSMIATPGEYVAQEWRQRTGAAMPMEVSRLNVSARALYGAARPVLQRTPIDWLVVVVDSMIADTMNRECWCNLFATHRGKISLVSTFELRRYAAAANRPYEAAVFGVALSILIAAMVPAIEYITTSSSGSIFDFCENRDDIVMCIRDPSIDSLNRDRIPGPILQATEQILSAMKRYAGAPSPYKAPYRGTSPRAKTKEIKLMPVSRKRANDEHVRGVSQTPFAGILKTLAETIRTSQNAPSVRSRKLSRLKPGKTSDEMKQETGARKAPRRIKRRRSR